MVNRNIDEMINDREAVLKEKLHIDLAKQKYADIKVPQGIKVDISNYSQRNYSKKLTYSVAGVIPILAIGLLVLFINISSAFAGYVMKVPLFGSIVELVKLDKDSEKVFEKKSFQIINQIAEDKGIKVTVNNIRFDKKRMIINYTLEANEENMNLSINDFQVLDKGEKKVEVAIANELLGKNYSSNKRSKTGDMLIYFDDDNRTFPEEMTFKILKLIDINRINTLKEETIEGTWNFKIQLNKELLKLEPKLIDINKEITLDKLKFKCKELIAYPSMTDFKIDSDENSEYKIVLFKNPRLIYDKGKIYNDIPFRESKEFKLDSQYTLHFESSYFEKFSSLSMEVEGVYYLPKDEQYIEINLKNKKITRSGTYGLEFSDATIDQMNAKNLNEENLIIQLRVTDKEFYDRINVNNRFETYLQFSKVYDENNVEIQDGIMSQYCTTDGANKDQILNIAIKKTEKLPEKLKLKVFTSNKYITAPFSVKLK